MKLYTDKDEIEVGQIVNSKLSEESIDTIHLDDDSLDTLNMAIENFKSTVTKLEIIHGVHDRLVDLPINTIKYYNAIESYSPILKSIYGNLGVTGTVPSMEDFKSSRTVESTHEIALEGLVDTIKKIWTIIKDTIAAFFKKIDLFFRRLLNHDLDVSNYEKLLDKMTVKIKNNSMLVSTTDKVIKSKLPSMLATPGMDSVSHEFLREVVFASMNTTSRLIQNTLINDTRSKMISSINNNVIPKVKELLTNDIQHLTDTSKIDSLISDIKFQLSEAITSIYPISLDKRELPEKVHTNLYNNFTNEETNSNVFTIRSLIEVDSDFNLLPNRYNVFLMNAGNEKLFISSVTEEQAQVGNMVEPIVDRNILLSLYKDYKNSLGTVDIKTMSKVSEELDRTISKLVDTTRNNLVTVLNTLEGVLKEVSMESNSFDHDSDTEIDQANTIAVDNAAEEISTEGDDIDIEALVARKREELSARNIRTSSADQDLLNIPEVSDKDRLRINVEYTIKAIKKFESYMTRILTILQINSREINVGVSRAYANLRLEVIKYIYNSARLYR